MKKNLGVAIAGIAMLALVGCIGVQHGEIIENADVEVETSQVVTIANPWSDCTEEEAYVDAPNGFTAPEGATEFVVKITTDSTCDFKFDDFTVSGKKYAETCNATARNLVF